MFKSMALIEAIRIVLLRREWVKSKRRMLDNEPSVPVDENTKPFHRMHWTVHIEGGPRRVNHAAVAVGQTIYSFGGYCTNEDYSIRRPIDVHILNSITYRWKIVNFDSEPSVPFQRYGHTVVAHGRFVYLWGGRNDENACKILYKFDTKTLKWSTPTVTGSIPGARDGHSAVIIRNKMFMFGGFEEDIGLFSQDVYSLDLATMTWARIPTAGHPPSFRDFHTATTYLDRYMFIFGGRGDRHGPFHTRNEMYCNTLVCLDIERQEWFRPKTHGDIPVARRSHSAFMHNGFLYIFGGYNGVSKEHMNDFHRYDPESGEWKLLHPCGEKPSPRRRQGCVVVDNRVFFFGGTSPSQFPQRNVRSNDQELNEEANLIDHDDMFVLDMEPSLKTVSMLAILKYKLDTSSLPKVLTQELIWMQTPNRITTPSG